MKIIRKAAGTLTAGEDRTARLVITTADVDRVGDVVAPEGVDLSHYKANPVLLMGHDHKTLIGRCEELAVEPGRRITAKAVFHDETDDARQAWRLVKMGYLNGVSIGFNPISPPTPIPPGPTGKSGWHYGRTELMEVSLTPVPANPHCTVLRSILDSNTLDGEPLCAGVRKSLEAAMSAIEKAAPPPPAEPPEAGADAKPNPEGGLGSPENIAGKIQDLVNSALDIALSQLLKPAPTPPAGAPGEGGKPPFGEEGEEEGEEGEDPFAEEEEAPGEGEEGAPGEEEEDPLKRYRRSAPVRRARAVARKKILARVAKTMDAGAVLREAMGHLEELGNVEPGQYGKAHGAACKYHHARLKELMQAMEDAAGDKKPDEEKPAEEKAMDLEEMRAVIAEALAPAREAVYRVTGRVV